MKRKILLVLFTCFFFLRSSAQCAMCRAVLESGEEQSAAEGINDGIMFLMAIPYILIGSIGYIVYRTYGKSKKNEITGDTL